MGQHKILCVRRSTLEECLGGIPLGFTEDAEVVAALQRAVRDAGEFRPRPELEEDPTFLQIIVQGLVTRGWEVLALFRAVREKGVDRFIETRLNAKVALSAGGHVEPLEAGADDVLHAAMLRELKEELAFAVPPRPGAVEPIGIICKAAPDASLLDRVHIGVVFRVPVTGDVLLPDGSDEFTHVEFVGPKRLRELYPRMEGWGQTLADAVLHQHLAVTAE